MREHSNVYIPVLNSCEVCGRVELLLTSVHDFLSKNQGLKPQLPFSLTKRASSTQSTAEKRIEKIFDYNPTTEYPTIDLLNRKAKKWNEQPLSFFARFEEPLDCDTNDPQQHLILCCLQLQESDAHSRILRRVYSLVLYRLRANRPRNDDVETIAQLIYDKLQKNGQEDLKALTKSIERMIQAGSRYENIVRSLGIGSLVVLGTTIPQTMWVSASKQNANAHDPTDGRIGYQSVELFLTRRWSTWLNKESFSWEMSIKDWQRKSLAALKVVSHSSFL